MKLKRLTLVQGEFYDKGRIIALLMKRSSILLKLPENPTLIGRLCACPVSTTGFHRGGREKVFLRLESENEDWRGAGAGERIEMVRSITSSRL